MSALDLTRPAAPHGTSPVASLDTLLALGAAIGRCAAATVAAGRADLPAADRNRATSDALDAMEDAEAASRALDTATGVGAGEAATRAMLAHLRTHGAVD